MKTTYSEYKLNRAERKEAIKAAIKEKIINELCDTLHSFSVRRERRITFQYDGYSYAVWYDVNADTVVVESNQGYDEEYPTEAFDPSTLLRIMKLARKKHFDEHSRNVQKRKVAEMLKHAQNTKQRDKIVKRLLTVRDFSLSVNFS